MYYTGAPTPSLNQKDLENQEKTRMGLMPEKNTQFIEDPKMTVAANDHKNDTAIIKDPSK